MCAAPIRGETWKLTYDQETDYGTDEGTANLVNSFGVIQTATLPDPVTEFQSFYGHSTTTLRNWFITYKGRQSLTGSIPDVILLNGYPLHLPIGTCTTSGAYTHTIAEARTLKSITLHVTNTDAEGNIELMRRYIGGKMGRATISASEGMFLTMSMEFAFINFSHNQTSEPKYSSGVADVTPSYPTTQPYLFSYGALELAGTPFARVKSFRLSIDNALEPKYYITDDAQAQLPYEHREGRRRYDLSCVLDIEDASLYKELIRQGTYSSVYKGFQTIITFTRGAGDTITITTPTTTPAAGGDAMGCLIKQAPHNIVADPLLSVPMDIICRNLGIVVVDAVSTYPGQEV